MTETSLSRRNFSISRSGKFKRRSKDRVSITDQHWITPDLDFEFERIIVSLRVQGSGSSGNLMSILLEIIQIVFKCHLRISQCSYLS